MVVCDLVEEMLGPDLPIAFEAYDGSRTGPSDPRATILVRSPDALRRIVTAPGELGFARAYVAGDLELEGDIYAVLALRDRLSDGPRLTVAQAIRAARMLGVRNLRPLPPPPEEVRLRGRLHTRRRDADAIAHHYDVSDDFYRLFLGQTMTYSCALFESERSTLEEAQAAKYELICGKLRLEADMRLLDIGCGWGGMVLHAARQHGVRAVGVTNSRRQAEWSEKRIADEGLSGRVEVRMQDYRDVDDGPFDAVSSIGMFEHVGIGQLAGYFDRIVGLLPVGGRLLNHAISTPPRSRPGIDPKSFLGRYVFPDGALHEVGSVVTAVQEAGLEARHVESLREHYALTLRRWVAHLEENWDEAVALGGAGRARVWHLYMAGSAVDFEANRVQVHQILAARTTDQLGSSGMPLRPGW